MLPQSAYLVIFFGIILSPFYSPIVQRVKTLGFTRSQASIVNIHGEGYRSIAGTAVCEDLHLYAPSNQLFAACEGGSVGQRYKWFPPLANFQDENEVSQGTIVVIDPKVRHKYQSVHLSKCLTYPSKTFTSKRLSLTGLSGPFVTHGIDVITGEDPATVYIFAVNHLPNPEYYKPTEASTKSPYAARSQIEVFRHVLGSDTAEYVRSVQHPDIQTPNDILATSPTSFYVTNDHYYRTGFMRNVEEVLTSYLGGWSTIVHVQITDRTPTDPTDGITVTTSLSELHNNNGLGRASSNRADEILINDASGGVLTRAWYNLDPLASHELNVIEHIQLDSTIDNPFYYDDPYATASNNASGFVLAGLARAHTMGNDYVNPEVPIPSLVWHVRRSRGAGVQGAWEKKVIFQDDGIQVRTATTAVMIGIDPKANGGRKQAWLYVTGFLTEAIVATKVDL